MEICKHCREELVECQNHSDESYETDLCDDCMDKYYGYCDTCGDLMLYDDNMLGNWTGIACEKCRNIE